MRASIKAILTAGALVGMIACDSPTEVNPNAPAHLTVVSGEGQTAAALSRLRKVIAVQVTNAAGQTVSGATVKFTVTTGAGDITPDSARTDRDGIAATDWTLGSPSGVQLLTIEVVKSGKPLADTVSAVAQVAGGVEVVAGSNQTAPAGGQLALPIAVVVRDTTGTPMEGQLVVFTPPGNGVVSEDSVVTDASGTASTQWRLGTTPGDQVLDISVPRPARTTLITNVHAMAQGMVRANLAGGPYGLAISGDVVLATALNGSGLAVGSLASRSMTNPVAVGLLPTGVAINPAGTEAYVTNQGSRTIGVFNIASKSQVATIPLGHDPFVVSFKPDGSRAFVATNDGVVYAINPSTRAVVDSVATAQGSNGLALSPDATKLYVSAFASGTVHEVNLATFTVTRTFNTGGAPQGLVVSPDGAELYVANEVGRIEVWALATGTRTTTIALPGGAFDLAMSPDGSRLAAGLVTSGRVSIVNRQTRSILSTVVTGGSPRRMQFGADGRTLVVANESGWIDFIL